MKTNLQNLKKSELIHFNEFLLKLIELTQKRLIYTLYRGDSLFNLYTKLGLPYSEEETEHKELLKRLFLIGEKAKNFYSDELIIELNSGELNSGRNVKIDSCNEEVLRKIFDNLNKAVKNKNEFSEKFFNINKAFKEYFLNKQNKISFVTTIQNSIYKLSLRNYYLKLLHQLASINYKNSSHFVSTTQDSDVAIGFASHSNSNKKVIIHCWSTNSYPIGRLRKLNLPQYRSAPYSWQKEESILAGILPHFIIGLQIV